MTLFRPCIDLHQGQVKQIVGGTLRDDGSAPKENFVSDRSPAWFAERFREAEARGGHIIQLGPGNETAAREALAAWPGGMQLGGGITVDNAASWLEAGASHVIVTSWLFSPEGAFLPERAEALIDAVGRDRVVLDLSCRRTDRGWQVAMNRWQTLTDLAVTAGTLAYLSGWASEFLVHAADVEGLQAGIDESLVSMLAAQSPLPVTYAGGARSLCDLERVATLSEGRVDLTIGSALDLFGGSGVTFEACVAWNRARQGRSRNLGSAE